MKKIYLFSLLSIFSMSLLCQVQPTVFNGSTVIDSIYSPALEDNLQGNPSTQPIKVYLPSGYDNYPDNKYPVIYLLHPYTGNHNIYYTDYGILETVNQLISNKSIIPMIIVTPNAKTIYDGSFYTNSYVSGNWEDFIVQEVTQHIEGKYRVLDQHESRGLSGFSMGAYGTAKLGMKHHSIFKALGIIGGPVLDMEEQYFNPPYKEYLINAAAINDYRPVDPWYTHVMFAQAVAFVPDSTATPILGRLPYTEDGVFIDSIWQKWLLHDPYTMLQLYKDSVIKYNTIQIYIGDKDDLLPNNETFHQALLDNGIEHGYEIYSGGHDPEPVLDDLLQFFSEQLIGTVPTIRSSSDFYLETTDTLMAETNMDGKLYVVPLSAGNGSDSIYKYQVATVEAAANEENEFQLSEFEYGKYRVFAVSSDSMVSNIPEEFCVVPDKSPPLLSLVCDTVNLNDSIHVSSSRDGMLYLVIVGTPPDLSMIRKQPFFRDSVAVVATISVEFATTDFHVGNYWLYAVDEFGIFSEPDTVTIEPASGVDENVNAGIRIYPNPANDLIIIETNKVGQYFIEITSLNGQLLYSDRMEGPNHQIDLSSFQKGLYFITIRSRDFVRTEKIIKL